MPALTLRGGGRHTVHEVVKGTTVAGMRAAITASHLTRSFGPTKALDDLDLEVATGEVHGFLGPNGAGKSTQPRVMPYKPNPEARGVSRKADREGLATAAWLSDGRSGDPN